jgi:hypothetical protein
MESGGAGNKIRKFNRSKAQRFKGKGKKRERGL